MDENNSFIGSSWKLLLFILFIYSFIHLVIKQQNNGQHTVPASKTRLFYLCSSAFQQPTLYKIKQTFFTIPLSNICLSLIEP